MKILLFFLLSFTIFSAHAEYRGVYFTLNIELKDGKMIQRYIGLNNQYMDADTISDVNQRIKKVDAGDFDSANDTISCFVHLIKYTYKSFYKEQPTTIYSPLELEKVPLSKIKNLTLSNPIEFGYLIGIASEHTIKDTIWMSQSPEMAFNTGGYWCDWQVFVHKSTPKVLKVKSATEKLDAEFEKQKAGLEAQMEQTSLEEKAKLEEQLEHLQDDHNDKKGKLLEDLKGEKVVIIAFCSC